MSNPEFDDQNTNPRYTAGEQLQEWERTNAASRFPNLKPTGLVAYMAIDTYNTWYEACEDRQYATDSSGGEYSSNQATVETICARQLLAQTTGSIFDSYYNQIEDTLSQTPQPAVTLDTFCAIVDGIELQHEADLAEFYGNTFMREDLEAYSRDISELYKVEGASNFTKYFDDEAKTNA